VAPAVSGKGCDALRDAIFLFIAQGARLARTNAAAARICVHARVFTATPLRSLAHGERTTAARAAQPLRPCRRRDTPGSDDPLRAQSV
jgi:hypothetical protein